MRESFAPPPGEDERPFRLTRRFEVVRRIGAGGMGIVYELVDGELGTRVAAKTLQRLAHDDIVRLKHEFRALLGLHHRNLVRLGELFEDEGRWFFTMELVDGIDVLRWVCGDAAPAKDASTRKLGRDAGELVIAPSPAATPLTVLPGPLPVGYDETRLRAALAQIAQALAYLHDAGKVHRDIKPSNILVDRDGRVVLLDFGVATDVAAPPPADAPVMGTEAFMAPEQLVARGVGPASDCYSVGVLLYRMLTGRLPDPNVRAAIRRVQLGVRLWTPRELVPEVPRDLDALCTALLDHDAAARPTARQIVERLGASQPHALAVVGDAPFVGRVAELRALEALLAVVESGGAPVAVFVEGESGVGKSALIGEFARRVPGARALTLRGRCYEHESVPYKALDEVIDLLAATMAARQAEGGGLDAADADLAAELFPALASIGSKQTLLPERRAEPQKRRRSAFAALRRLLGRLAATRPVILAIDDLQWTDADSVQLLAELLRGPDAPRLLLLATVRASGDAADPTARAILERLGDVRRLPLGPLGGADAVQFAKRLAAEAELAAVDVDAIVDAASGHPLFIDVLVRHQLERRGDGALRLEDALRTRLIELSPPARALVEHVALAGGPLVQEVAAAAVEMDADGFAAAVAQLRAARLCRTSGALPSDLIEPYHDRVRETVVLGLDGERRRRAHERLALAFERANGGRDAERIATHFREAGQPGRARRYYLEAATGARQALAFDRAARLYRLALGLTPGTSQLHASLGEVLVHAGRGAEAADAFIAAAALAEPEQATELKRLAADQLLRSGRIDQGLAILREVFAAAGLQLPSSPRRALLTLLLARARVRLRGIVFSARRPSDLSPSELLRIDLSWSAAVGLAMVDNIRGSGFQTLNLLLSLRAGEPLRIARALGFEACFSANGGTRTQQRTARLCAAAEAMAERTGDPYALAWAAAARAASAVLEGRFFDAPARIALAESRFRDIAGANWERTTIRRIHITTLVARGRFAELQERVPAELADALERGDLFTAVNMRTGLANVAWLAADDPKGARRVVAEAMASWSQQGFFMQHYFELLALAQIDLYEGEGTRALTRIRAAWPDLRRSQVLRVEFIRCLMLHLRGRAAIAAGTLDEAAGAARRLEAIGERARGRALVLRAAIAEQLGDRPGALRALRSARARFEAVDLRGYLFGAHHVEARLVGDAAQAAAAEAYFAVEHVRNPAHFVRMMLPGL